ncbi:S-adenosyl-L-methionine-dependent methyltransferase [Auriculariales sp. MPI-PUGE-AT-0066]|nr:S-adenosyl-L-methionine-dependent methyltransferase [Auriculariales sp. MPI-PUGE-AT-0066]
MAAANMYSVPGGTHQSDSGSYSGSGGSYGSDSDAMSVSSSQQRGSGMDLDSARGCSPAPSIYSYHPSIDGNALREVHGRYFNSQNETYMLPADSAEHGRLGLQHDSLTLAIGSLYQNKSVVHEVLASRPGYTPSIIDIGCGTGTWCVAMAKQFPHCEVVGVDLAPPAPGECSGSNVPQANLGFPHFYNCFDIVNCRSITSGIVNYPYFLRECSRVLKPGGNFEGLTVCEEGEPGYSWLQRIFFGAYNSMKNRGAQIDGMTLTPRWIRDIPDFENVATQDVYIPIGPWLKGDPRVELLSELMLRDTQLVISAMKPMLMSEGYFEDTVDTFIEEAQQELREQSVHIYSVWHYAWARKTLLPTLPDEKTIAESSDVPTNNAFQPTTSQILSPSGAAPGSAPIYPPAPAPINQAAVPPAPTRPSVRNEPTPGGCKPCVPHAPSRYDNYVPPQHHELLDLPSVYHARTDQPGLATLAQLQPEVFAGYWNDAQAQQEVLRQQAENEALWQQQRRQQLQEQSHYDALLAAHMQEQLSLDEQRNQYPAFGGPGPSSRPWGSGSYGHQQ